MNKDTKYMLKMFLPLFVIIMTFGFMTMGVCELSDYLRYNNLDKEGYKVELTFDWKYLWECKINVLNQDNSESLMNCKNIGNEYSLENFAIKK